MATEKLSKKRYHNLIVVEIQDDDEFKRLRKYLDKENNFFSIGDKKFNLFILKQKEKNNAPVYYVYDYFNSAETLSELRTIEKKDQGLPEQILTENPHHNNIEEISFFIKGSAYIKYDSTVEDIRNKENFITQYGYPHNYRSKINFWKASGSQLGGLIGALLTLFFMILLIAGFIFGPSLFGLPLIVAVITKLAVFLGIGVLTMAGGYLIGMFGSIVGALIGAAVHYCEKCFVGSKSQNQQQTILDESPNSSLNNPVSPEQTQNPTIRLSGDTKNSFSSVFSKTDGGGDDNENIDKNDALDPKAFFKYCFGG